MGQTAKTSSPGNDDLSIDNRAAPARQTAPPTSASAPYSRRQEKIAPERQRDLQIESYQTLVQAQSELEQQIKIRTEELLKANAELKREIDERRTTEQALLDREADLQMEKDNLQQANTAMKVLLKRREADKRALEEQVLYNIKTMVVPYLHKLKRVCNDDRQQTYINIAESNLKDVTGGFSRRLSLTFYNLTGSEIKVATLIRQGKKSREIAKMLGLSVRTVEANRQSIRNKLNISNKSVNLRTFLMSLE